MITAIVHLLLAAAVQSAPVYHDAPEFRVAERERSAAPTQANESKPGTQGESRCRAVSTARHHREDVNRDASADRKAGVDSGHCD